MAEEFQVKIGVSTCNRHEQGPRDGEAAVWIFLDKGSDIIMTPEAARKFARDILEAARQTETV